MHDALKGEAEPITPAQVSFAVSVPSFHLEENGGGYYSGGRCGPTMRQQLGDAAVWMAR